MGERARSLVRRKTVAGQVTFKMDPLPKLDLWTDGSGTGGAPGGWAFILRFQLHDSSWVEHCESGWEMVTTNNRMELTAFLMGLRALKRPCRVTLHSDSEYVIKPLREGWIVGWQRKRWHKVKNPDIWQDILRAAMPHTLEFQWCAGHTGVEHNEECDKLAGQARAAAIRQEAAFL
jgi:ribonuclease HI